MRVRTMWPLLKTMLSCNHNLSSTKIVKGSLLTLAKASTKEGPKAQWGMESHLLVDSGTKLPVLKNSFKIPLTIAISNRTHLCLYSRLEVTLQVLWLDFILNNKLQCIIQQHLEQVQDLAKLLRTIFNLILQWVLKPS